MKTIKLLWFFTMFLIQISVSRTTAQQQNDPCNGTQNEYYSAVEISDILCGYSIDRECLISEEEKEVLYQTADVSLKLSVLGQGVDISLNFLYKLNPVTRRWFFNKTEINNGGAIVHSTTEIKGDTAFFHGNEGTKPKKVLLPPEVQFESNLSYPHLVRDFINGSVNYTVYNVFDILTGEIVEKKYFKKGEEDVILNDITFHAIVLEETDLSKGTKAKIWFDTITGLPLKTFVAGRNIYLTDKSVVDRITKVNFDNVIFARVNKVIPDFQQLTYMKVKARIESAGEVITAGDLNCPGQKFTGSVTDNLADGIFELEPVKYNGVEAPPFPPDFNNDKELKKYLEPERLIESDDPALMNEARKITEGSKDSWEAAKRLSMWVSENIEGAIPGGTSAINTYNTRQGECGSHSRLLAAFCRSVCIPARLSVGCMYTPHYKGSFGQHAWNEVYMGNAGWIPVDATIFETDYVDAGHIRLGEMTSFQPKEMQILDYRVKGDSISGTANNIPYNYIPYLGKYTNLFKNGLYTILFQDNSLAVDIPGQMVLALNAPDEEGRFYPKITRQIFFKFYQNNAGQVEKLTLTQLLSIPRQSGQDSISPNLPESLAPFIGTYNLPQAQIKVDVTYKEGTLAITDILGRTAQYILLQEENEKWTDKESNYEIVFEKNESGEVIRILAGIIFPCPKGEPAAILIEPVINESGIEEGLKKYNELKASNQGEYLFLESMMNDLGYRLLSQGKIADAIEVFKMNAEEYPDSFNVYDSLGEAYMKMGDKGLAILNYEKSVSLNPDNENGKRMLENIRSGN